MSAKEQTHSHATASSKGRSAKPIAHNSKTPIPQTQPTALAQQAQIDPKSLTPSDVLQLQRTMGNRAAGKLLSGAKPLPVIQAKGELTETVPTASAGQRPNHTGLPDNLKAGIENLSGISLDNVQVHYNSDKPVSLNALAYTQGTDIHVAPGQERHLPHEAWHVVQQAQGRVTPTVQMKDRIPVNDDQGLEHEADVMGARAADKRHFALSPYTSLTARHSAAGPIQRKIFFADSLNAEAASANRPYADRIWASPLASINNELFPTAAAAEGAAMNLLGVASPPDYTVQATKLEKQQNGVYNTWNGANPPALVGVPTHNQDDTNVLYEVSNAGWRKYAPIIHNHAVEYADFAATNNPGTPYTPAPGAREHYLHKPTLEKGGLTKHAGAVDFNSQAKAKKEKADSVVDEILKK